MLSIIPLFLSAAGFRFAKDTRGGGFLLTHVVKSNKGEFKHEKDKTLQLVEALGVAVENREEELNVPAIPAISEVVNIRITGAWIRYR